MQLLMMDFEDLSVRPRPYFAADLVRVSDLGQLFSDCPLAIEAEPLFVASGHESLGKIPGLGLALRTLLHLSY